MRHWRTRNMEFNTIYVLSNTFTDTFSFHAQAVYRQDIYSKINRIFSHNTNRLKVLSYNNLNLLNDVLHVRELKALSFIFDNKLIEGSHLKIDCSRVIPWYSSYMEDKRPCAKPNQFV